jgi:predicted secreted protein
MLRCHHCRSDVSVLACAILLVAGDLTGCSSALEPSDPDDPIQVRAGHEFKIILESHPDGGYHWDLTGKPDENEIQFGSKEQRINDKDKDLIGNSGFEIFKFKAITAGTTTLVFGEGRGTNYTGFESITVVVN